MLVSEFLAKNKDVIMLQPLYSPDLGCADIFLLPKLKTPLRGKDCEEIKEKWKHELLMIPKSAFQMSFEDWKIRWHNCVIFEGSYFAGDKIDIDK